MKNELFVYGKIGAKPTGADASYLFTEATSFIAKLSAIPASEKEIHVYFNSPGGSVVQGFAMYDALLRHPARKIGHVVGWAVSMGGIVLMAMDEIYMPGNAWFMMHNPSMGVEGDGVVLRRMADVVDKMKNQAIDAYSRHNKSPRATIEKWMELEIGTWVAGSDAAAFGFDFLPDVDIMDAAASFDPAQLATAPAAALALFNKQPQQEHQAMLKTLREKMGKPEATEAEAVAFAGTLKAPEAILELTDAAFAEGEAKAKAEGATALATALAAKDAEIAAVKTANDAAAATAKAAYDELADKHERLMGGLKPPSGKSANGARPAFAEFRAKVVAVMADAKVDESEAGVKVRRDFSALYDAMISEANQK